MSGKNVLIIARYVFVAYSMLILVLVSYDYKSAFAAPTLKDTNLKVVTVASGLHSPTSMAFIGPNDILVLEKNTGLVKRVKNGAVLPGSLLDVSVATNSERGLLGIDVAKVGSSTTQFNVFLYYTLASKDGGSAIANRIYKYNLEIGSNLGPSQGRMTLSALLLNLPATPGPNHDGGKVVIGPDSNVYTVIGDLNRQTQAQNFETGPPPDGSGGILRVTQDGKPAGSIIGSGHPLNKYFAYGVRNSFGIEFDPVTHKLWDSENGPSSNDEINMVDPGFNSGWKDLMGYAPAGFNFNNLANFGGKGKYSNPEFVWTQVVAPTALKFFSSSKLGTKYQNDLFVADFNKGRIYDFNLNSGRSGFSLSGVLSDRNANTDSELQQIIFGEGFGGITDLKVGSGDGYLYVLSIGNGAIYKILPKSAAATTSATTTSADNSDQRAAGNNTNPFASNMNRTAHIQPLKQQDNTKRPEELRKQQQREQDQQPQQQLEEKKLKPLQQEQQKQVEMTAPNQASDILNNLNNRSSFNPSTP
jgi:aldose sugar dehydrogenase